MRETYIHDPDFGKVMEKIQQGESSRQYSLKDGYLLKHDKICVTQD